MVWVGTVGARTHWSFGVVEGLAVGIFVLAHEFGHLAVGHRQGISPKDVTLFPVGGVATFATQAQVDLASMYVTIAGPITSAILAFIFAVPGLLRHDDLPVWQATFSQGNLVDRLYFINMLLCVFNLIPAFPMDGGRLLRQGLTRKYDPIKATIFSSRVGQAVAICFAFFGIVNAYSVLVLVGLFIFLGASQEAGIQLSRLLLKGHKVKEAMVQEFKTLESGMTADAACKVMLQSSQKVFPIVVGEEVLGVLTESALLTGLNQYGGDVYLAEIMNKDFPAASPDQDLESAIRLLNDGGQPVIVLDNGALKGILTAENFTEFLMIVNASQRPK